MIAKKKEEEIAKLEGGEEFCLYCGSEKTFTEDMEIICEKCGA